MTRPPSSTSPSNAASSTVGKHNESGRMVDRFGGSCILNTLFRMRNRSSTINCLLDVLNPCSCGYQSSSGQMWSNSKISHAHIHRSRTEVDWKVKRTPPSDRSSNHEALPYTLRLQSAPAFQDL